MSEQRLGSSIGARMAQEAKRPDWQIEPEIDRDRQVFLAERRSIVPDRDRDIYPFKDIKLSRADIEWLLATHESSGIIGPIDWNDEGQRSREGLDLRGADLSGHLDLSNLPLARVRFGDPFSGGSVDATTKTRRRRVRRWPAYLLAVLLILLSLFYLSIPAAWVSFITVDSYQYTAIFGAIFYFTLILVLPLTARQSYRLRKSTPGSARERERKDGVRANVDRRVRDGNTLQGSFTRDVLISYTALAYVFFLIGVIVNFQTPDQNTENIAILLISGAYLATSLMTAVNLHRKFTNFDRDGQRFITARKLSANLNDCTLQSAHLEGAILTGVKLIQANMQGAFLADANLDLAYCYGTDMRNARLSEQTSVRLTEIAIPGFPAKYCAALGGIKWGGCDISQIRWSSVSLLGDEQFIDPSDILTLYDAARLYRTMSRMLREAGLTHGSDRMTYRALVIERRVSVRDANFFAVLGSYAMDQIAGYGYKFYNTLRIYGLLIGTFALGYYFLAPRSHVTPPLSPLGAIVLSITSFHGRGFFPSLSGSLLDSPLTVLAALEAIFGLFVEVSIIATFTQRYFAGR